MSSELMKSPSGMGGAVPAIASAVIPGLGQLLNREKDKAIGVFAVVVGGSLLSLLPFIGWIPALAMTMAWIYGVVDGYVTGRERSSR